MQFADLILVSILEKTNHQQISQKQIMPKKMIVSLKSSKRFAMITLNVLMTTLLIFGLITSKVFPLNL